MPMTVIVSSNVRPRFTGFLGSVMVEVAPSVYLAAAMNTGVRERVWETLSDWHAAEPQGSIVLIWGASASQTGIKVAYLGLPRRDLIELDGLLIVRRIFDSA